ncbi:MAG TPA: hypothetical protein EYP56_07245 [Planctomycetaceae bacterium]|nr:hypothetical protein [Planctomycetaceae bacterium]
MKKPCTVPVLVCLVLLVSSDLWAQPRPFGRFRAWRLRARQSLRDSRLPDRGEPTAAPRATPGQPAGPTPAQAPQLAAAPLVYPLGQLDPPPFSRAWYDARPEAWRPPAAPFDPFAATDPTALALWLGLPDLTRPVPPATDAAGGKAEASPGPRLFVPGESEQRQWMPVGVFAVRPQGSPPASRLVQLAIAPDGTIRGTHYDLLTGAIQSVSGQVDRGQLMAVWAADPQHLVRFEAPLAALTQPHARWTARHRSGSSPWELVRTAP